MTIRVHVLHTGGVRVSPSLPFGGENCNVVKASGLLMPERKRVWRPVSAYLVEHPRGLVLIDCGWSRAMSPDGFWDPAAQKRHLSRLLYPVNQGEVGPGQTAREQLAAMGIEPGDLECIVISHLDCDHASGLRDFEGVRRVLVSADELSMAENPRGLTMRMRFQKIWWEGMPLETFELERTGVGPVGRSHDLFGDGSVELVNIPGHTVGQIATVIRGEGGRFVNYVADGAYGQASWRDMILPGISLDKDKQRASLQWIHDMAADPLCVKTLANHDVEVGPQVIEV